jgi:hypothetical protein
MIRSYQCACECHPSCQVHITAVCTCGKPVKPPASACPPPPKPCQPGVVDIPQDTPPPPSRTSPNPVWQDPDRPRRGDPAEIPWFRGKIGGILRKGPTFGPRKDEYLPYLVIRSSSSDRGDRPVSGVFWESPDIFVLPNVDAAVAPLMPPQLGLSAIAGAPNTLYAHIWNLGKSPAYRVRVEFYWFNPSLGISRADSNLVGAAYVDLGDRFTHFPDWKQIDRSYGSFMSRGAHAIVRCPVTWTPAFVNNGHECLVVRAFEQFKDPLSPDHFSAAADRHVAQRNIAVVMNASPAELDLDLDLGYPQAPGPVTINIEVGAAPSMEFLRLRSGRGGPPITAARSKLVAGLMPPTLRTVTPTRLCNVSFDCRGPLLQDREAFERGCELVKVAFHAAVQDLGHNEAHVVRIRQRSGTDVIGGYSVVLLGTSGKNHTLSHH